MEYLLQLQTDEWKSKRKQVLLRDGYNCQNCFNLNVSLSSNFGAVIDSYYSNDLNYKTVNIESISGKFHSIRSRIGVGIDLRNRLVAFRKFENNYAITGITNRKIFRMDRKVIVKIDNNGDWIIPELQDLKYFNFEFTLEDLHSSVVSFNWLEIGNLHVHHKYYQNGKLAWEYPDNALITLCWKCHENLHKDTVIKVLDENGIVIEEKKYCNRCFGLGYLPEFYYVKNGICFRCNGGNLKSQGQIYKKLGVSNQALLYVASKKTKNVHLLSEGFDIHFFAKIIQVEN